MDGIRTLVAALALVALLGATGSAQKNVLLIIADDLGVDMIGAYGEATDPANTPVINQLAANGVLFRNAWSNPGCSLTRASMMTGRHAFRTGIGWNVAYADDHFELYPEEVSIADLLAPTYRTAAVGKWHLGAKQESNALHPQLLGFDHYRGNLTVLGGIIGQTYFNFPKVIDGVESTSTTYSTTDIVDDALDLIRSFGERPWFVWMAFNNPHAPFHKPPASLHTYALPEPVSGNIPIHARAMTEAMDTELGRLFASMSPAVLANTIIIFVGDNGTDGPVVLPPFDPAKAKGTMYEGGLNVPLIVYGSGVAAGAECAGLVNLSDLFATIAEIAGVSAPIGTDSVSIVPYFSQPGQASLRPWVYSEVFKQNLSEPSNGFGPYVVWDRAVRDDRHKLIWELDDSLLPTTVRFFDLTDDPFETVNLLDAPLGSVATQAFAKLTLVMQRMIPRWLDIGHGLAGVFGVPKLVGSGEMIAGRRIKLELSGAAPLSVALLIFGPNSSSVPFKGGVRVPVPDMVVKGFTGFTGKMTVSQAWPALVPTGVRSFYQFWIYDFFAPAGLAASNALVATAP